MSLRVLVFAFVAALLAAVAPAAAQIPIPPGWQPERAVVLQRDGVHAPAQTNEDLDKYVATPWPVWPVTPGALMPSRAELLRLLGAYHRARAGGRALPHTPRRRPAGTAASRADTDQRTRDTGAALISGLYPRCANLAP